VPEGADLLILAVPDDALAPTVAVLADAAAIHAGQIVAHTSGAHGVEVLAPVAGAGVAGAGVVGAGVTGAAIEAWPLAIHPAMTFAGTPLDLERLNAGIAFGVTAPAALRPFVERLVGGLNGTVEWIVPEVRPLYHAALAHGANHLVTLVNEAADLLRAAGVHGPERVLRPLLSAALDNALQVGDAALTGPVARGDAGTVAAHLAILGAIAPASVPPYAALARRTADRAAAAGTLRPSDAARVLDVLDVVDVRAVPKVAA
jgi:predicted short-subunit dehydrogenase-like oxidoreductase (DUF2520 family)